MTYGCTLKTYRALFVLSLNVVLNINTTSHNFACLSDAFMLFDQLVKSAHAGG